MAGGAAINIFKFNTGSLPKETLNAKLWFAVFAFGLMGAARGVDEGLITGVFNSHAFKLSVGIDDLEKDELASIKGTISSMVQLGSVAGALFAFVVCDRIGRVWATRQLCCLWILGIAIFIGNNGNMGAVYAGRFVAGLGIGQTCVVGPIYLSEISPAPIRGLCTCMFTGAVYLGIMIAYFANWGTQIHMADSFNRWAVPTSLHLMFAGIILILTLFQLESPRFYIKQGKREKALEVLCKLRGLPADHPYVLNEITEMDVAFQEEMEATLGMGWKGLFKEILGIKRNAYRLFLTNLAQNMACWSGGSAITVYAPDLFTLVGITGQEQSLFSTVVFGVVKFVAAIICALFLVDMAGRKRSLIIGIVLQTIAMFYIAIFLNLVPIAENPDFVPSKTQNRASTAAIAFIYISGVGWALGWNSGQYLLSSELFPLRIRGICSSITMAMHFICQYAVNRALPEMLLKDGGLGPHGTFYFFGVISVLGGFWVWLFVPEAAGRSLETIDKMFDLPWYRIGLYGRKFAEEYDREQEQIYRDEKRDAGAVFLHNENA
ncbi:Major facilitator superfamily domain, general substrate transporter [Penicillium expansum]|uniref:Major facilitator superfamily domain, general substrate transporter n=1 Tax=Penicillium expansum TaxID=27334 RepID=A0A0A2JMC6_PENEN|nr:Major facilitator superfamily domain, general substrate transporter [Penicillium expansum]KGO52910.1 Major facilitator superfamily domain, general substrate transporter [Penicillium expansum]KGO55788.1 Major facilitator superfamily domain, general substrate transporter [Penicillium expansum]